MRRRHSSSPAAVLAATAAVLLAAASAVAPAAARAASFVVETGSMRIRQPPDIAGSFDSAIGDFGVPLYGGTLTGAVVYAGSLAGATDGLGCKEYGQPLPKPASGLPTVLLVDRGDCFFVQKAYYGQLAGAQAVLVTDHTDEGLLTMAVPEDRPEVAALVPKISIPVVLVTKSTGDSIKRVLQAGGSHPDVEVEFDWKESIGHPDNRVEWEFWFTSQDACGPACDSMRSFLQAFRDTGESLERESFTQFTPHVMSRACSRWLPTDVCSRECIHRGRYCSIYAVASQYADRYSGAQVMEQNKRHLCAFKVLNDTQHEPWRWWTYAAGFAGNCTMAAGRYDAGCAEEQLQAAGVDVAAVSGCMGSSDDDRPHEVMEAQLAAQEDRERSGRGRVILLPTVVINTDQYRGSLAAAAVLRAICAGFAEGSEPPICLSGSLNVDDCASGTDTCWRGTGAGGQPLTACVDTFRGFVCRCPQGWEGDGQHCKDIDECALHIDGCDQQCVNTPGSYRCECNKGYTLHGGQGAPGMCIPNSLSGSRLPAWLLALLVVASVVLVSLAGMFVYRWRIRREMQAEVHAIMREYLPLGSTDADTAALSESLLSRSPGRTGSSGGGGGSPGGRRKPGVAAQGGADLERGGVAEVLLPATPARPAELTEMTEMPSPSPRRLIP